jgi:hypothetical protein
MTIQWFEDAAMPGRWAIVLQFGAFIPATRAA